MSRELPDYTLIDRPAQLEEFYEENRSVDWMGFDTEFMGEKRFYTLLCLIQVATENGYYLIDPIALKDLGPFLDIMDDPDIIKITHAGENDYRILFNQYDRLPKNIFDTQIAGGFIGYKYPTAFRHIVDGELGQRINKSYAVTAWNDRPLQKKQIAYALNDVIPLKKLYDQLTAKLKKKGRLEWAMNECSRYEDAVFYEKDPDHEALRHNLMKNLKTRERVFLIRLLRWRRNVAEERNSSLEMVLSSKYIGPIVRGVSSGIPALQSNRRLSDRMVKRYGEFFVGLYEQPITEEENDLLERIPPPERPGEPAEELVLELLYILIKHRSLSAGIAPGLLPAKSALRRMKEKPELFDHLIGNNWRKEFLGPEVCHWLKNIDKLDLQVDGGAIKLV